MLPAREMIASMTTVPSVRVSFAISGYCGRIGAISNPAITPEEMRVGPDFCVPAGPRTLTRGAAGTALAIPSGSPGVASEIDDAERRCIDRRAAHGHRVTRDSGLRLRCEACWHKRFRKQPLSAAIERAAAGVHAGAQVKRGFWRAAGSAPDEAAEARRSAQQQRTAR